MIAKYRRELELQLRGGAQRTDGERVLRVTEWRCKRLGENVRATPIDRNGRQASLTNIRRQPEGDNVRAAWRRRDVLADGIGARGEERLKVARMRRSKRLGADHVIVSPEHRPAAEVSRFKPAIGNKVCSCGLSYAQPKQAHHCQDAVKTMFSRCHFDF